MMNAQMTERLEIRWVPVVDDRGRAHMQATWVGAGPGADTAPHLAPAAAGSAAHAA